MARGALASNLGSPVVVVTALGVALFAAGCAGDASSPSTATAARVVPEPATYQAEVEEGPGAALVILVDTSGSMSDVVQGDGLPKHQMARKALQEMLNATDAFLARRPDFPIRVAIYSFASNPFRVLPMQPYDHDRVTRALAQIPQPGGHTGIGEALRAARPELYRAGVFRKYIVVVTDGENTSGAPPERVAREIFRKSEGAVRTYFVAFDTRPEKFGFLKEVGGDVIAAQNGAQLRQALDEIYQGKILAEAIDAGEKPLASDTQ